MTKQTIDRNQAQQITTLAHPTARVKIIGRLTDPVRARLNIIHEAIVANRRRVHVIIIGKMFLR